MNQNDEIKDVAVENKWVRFAYMLLFLFFYSLAEILVGAIVLVQFIFVVIKNSPNEPLKVFGAELALYIKEIIGYVTYNHNRKVYPFQAWEKVDDSTVQEE